MKVIWSRRSIRHLVELREYIARDSDGSATLVAEKILQAVDLLLTHSGIGRPGRIVGTRELVVAGTPYIIPYRIRRDRLELIAALHGRQKWPAKF